MRKILSECRACVSLLLVIQLVLPFALLADQPQIPGLYSEIINNVRVPVNQLPQLRTNGLVRGVKDIKQPQANKLVVNQNEDKAVIDWESFNIGEEAWVQFNQKGNTDWSALNRIYDENPSMIFGKLTADGKIFLINKNGILFSPTSQVDVHSLAASSLAIAEEDFLNNVLKFEGDDSAGAVSNHGNIQAGTGGYVSFMGPEVENAGTIAAPSGQIALIAGNDVEMKLLDRTFPYIWVAPGEKGTAVNTETGSIIADAGLAGMYGRQVNQSGYIRSISAITNNGKIELKASEKVTTGPASRTISPISDNQEKVHSSFELQGGEIEISGLDQKKIVNIATNEIKNQTTSTKVIIHSGEIAAKSGTITMDAMDRIYMDAGSRLDVSGEWVDRSSDSVDIDAPLNSVELKNDFSQKGGELEGETITVLPQEGSTIGDLSAHLNGEYVTAREMATAGGKILLQAENGDIIIRDGYDGKEAALVDFSGGGARISDGHHNITKLVSGNNVYDISEAPESLQYDCIANYQEFVNQRYGMIEKYKGLYFGGAAPLFDSTTGYIQGDDAGTLSLVAKGIVLDGVLLGSATAGIYQTEMEIPVELYGNYTLQTLSGVKAPRGGELFIGPESPQVATGASVDNIVDEVVIVHDALVLPEDFSAETELKTVSIGGNQPYLSEFQNNQGPLFRSMISADKLSAAGLSNLTVQSNTKITVYEDAVLKLWPGGFRLKSTGTSVVGMAPEYWDTAPARLELSARALEFNGNIEIPGGEVNFIIKDTLTSELNPQEEQIEMRDRLFMSNGAGVVVSGERIDNSLAGNIGEIKNGFIDGGSIHVLDNTYYGGEVILGANSLLDVSGGYEITSNGNIKAGSAGSIELKGKSLVLRADLRGHSLIGETGGAITLHTDTIIVDREGPSLSGRFEFDDELPDELKEQLVLKQDQLADTGFSDITLLSYKDLTFAGDSLLEPSGIKMAFPEPALQNPAAGGNLNPAEAVDIQGLTLDGENEYVKVPLEFLGDSGITAKAGQPVVSSEEVSKEIDTYTVYVQPNATIKVAPEGHITLSGLITDIAGSLIAPSGDINLTASGYLRDLIIRNGSIISADGYNREIPESYIAELGYQYDILDGGTVTLTAKSGNILMEQGSRIDISGSRSVNGIVYRADGGITTNTMAASAGSLSLKYFNDLTLNGELIGDAYNETVHGASLSIIKENLYSSMTVDENDFIRYIAAGFDDVSLGSFKELVFSGNINVADKLLLRRLTLDAPLISGNETDQKISFDATEIILANTQAKYGGSLEQISYLNLVDDAQSLAAGDGDTRFALDGEYIEINGSVAVSGFNTVALDATKDIQLTDDVYYNNAGRLIWKGQLRTPEDLIVRAARIYPTTYSDFTLVSDAGRITTLRRTYPIDGPIVSAGGALTIAANEIDHQGFLAAPMGQIQFKGPDLLDDDDKASTVFLGGGSVTSVTAEGTMQYGYLDEDANWLVDIKPREWTNTSLVNYELLESLPEKSVTINGDTVVMQTGALIDFAGGGTVFSAEFTPGTKGLENPLTAKNTYIVVPGIDYPGPAVQLTEGSGLPAGTYSLLPEEYAFLTGAYVIQNLGSINKSGGAASYTDDGYAIITGYKTEAGTDLIAAVPDMYSIRPASEVIEQSEFNVNKMTSGGGGRLDIKGATTVLEGDFTGNAIAGYQGGALALSGTKSSIIKSTATLGGGYGFDDIADLIEPYVNTGQILDTTVSESNLSELHIGTLSLTDEVIVAEDAVVKAPYVQFSADNSIQMEKNSKLMGNGIDSEVVFNTPDGDFKMESGSSVSDFGKVEIKASSALFKGQMTSTEGTLVITTNNMVVGPEDHQERVPDTLYLLTGNWAGFSGFDNLEMNADTSLTLAGGTFLDVAGTLTMNSPAILYREANELSDIGIDAQEIYLVNTTGDVETVLLSEKNGHLALNAKETIGIGHGDIFLGGFNKIDMECKDEGLLGDVLLRGEGSLVTDGDLTFTAARVISSFYAESDSDGDQTTFESTRFLVQAGNDMAGYNTISIVGNGSTTGFADSSYGGTLEFVGDTIHLSGSGIGATGGWVTLTANEDETGGQSIALLTGAFIDVSGNDYLPGGRVTLVSDAGDIVIGQDCFIDVSAGNQGDAGIIKLLSPKANIRVDGEISGHAADGTGGGFYMDSHQILETDTGPLLDILENGGFDYRIDLRLRTGNFTLAKEETLRADQVKITADSGDVLIEGIIDASGASGGNVEINAGNEIDLEKDSRIYASADKYGEDAGSVYLNAANINFEEGSRIIVSSEGGTGGVVHFRTLQTDAGNDVRAYLAGTVAGASNALLEGVKVYQDESISLVDIDGYHEDADDFLTNSESIQNRLVSDGLAFEGGIAENIRIVPGIAVQSSGDLTLSEKWDLTERNRSEQAGYITLRAEGDLILDQSLVDHPTVVDVYNNEYIKLNDEMTVLPDAWGFNLIAGADPDGSDVQSTFAGQGDLIFNNDQVVYTENNAIRFAAGQDVIFYGVVVSNEPTYAYMVNAAIRYNLGSYNGDIQGHVGRDLVLMNHAAIQSAIGAIDITVGRNLHMQLNDAAGSAIRTTGTGSTDELTNADWNYAETHDGGDIRLDIQGQLRMGDVNLNEIYLGIEQENHIPFYNGTAHLKYWDNLYVKELGGGITLSEWSADYTYAFFSSSEPYTPTGGVATMGGGSVSIHAGAAVHGQAGTFKSGDLSVFSNGDLSGFFQIADGRGDIAAIGNIISPDKNLTGPDASLYSYATSLAIFDAQVAVTAAGGIDFGTIYNPTFPETYAEYSELGSLRRYLDYGEEASVSLSAINGNMALSGSFWSGQFEGSGNEDKSYRVLPPTVALFSGGDIQLGSGRGGDFVLSPSPYGNLTIHSDGSISGLYQESTNNQLERAVIRMSDMDPNDIYRLTIGSDSNDPLNDLFANETLEGVHRKGNPLHIEDPDSISIYAGEDIRELEIIAAKQTSVYADGDISGVYFFGQNINEDDETVIHAGGSIDLQSLTAPWLWDTGFRNAGPGIFVVEAGDSIDLGTTQGIQSVGNAFYSALEETDGLLAVIAGYDLNISRDGVAAFFNQIKKYGKEYSKKLAEGDAFGAAEAVAAAETNLIDPFFKDKERGDGRIDMTSSSIQTVAEGCDLYVFANGDVNVGLTAIPDPLEIASGQAFQTDTGLFTTKGGDMNIFSVGNLNVNESRIMTFRGGDVAVWSDKGDINAGRGSKTAVNAGSPKSVPTYDKDGNIISIKIEWEPPSVGSGIRTLTYDPDGFQGTLEPPPAGDAFLFAPKGIIDAGEAGISAANLILGATKVLNAQNIDVAGLSVGVPQASTGPSIGVMAGAGTVSESSKVAEESAVMKSAEDRFANAVTELSENLVPKWLAVEVIGFVVEDEDDKAEEKK
ncbi:MAG: filamentous hemagglutinin family protein [Pseudomonadota bacterium]